MRLTALNLAKKHTQKSGPRRIFLGTFVSLLVLLGWLGYSWAFTAITIEVDGKNIAINSLCKTVNEALDKAGVKLEAKDLVIPGMSTKLTEGMVVKVARATDVLVTADGKSWTVKATPTTVKDALAESNVKLGTLDKVIPALDTKLTAGLKIRVIRVQEKLAYERMPLPFKVETVTDRNMDVGARKVVSKGVHGVSERVWKVLLEDGKEIKRNFVTQKVIQQPVNQKIAMGARDTKYVSRYGNIRYSRVLVVNSSAYTYTGNNMSTGRAPFRGAVAVDPRVIPLGTKLYIEGYGPATALDIGGDIKGNRIDVFMESSSEAFRWGLRSVKVYILK